METLADAEDLSLSNDGAAESKTAHLNVVNGKGVVDEKDEEELGEEDDIEDEDEDEDDYEGEEDGRVFSVGEFVWGKIKHHPWWPGQIYDASDASDLALKHKPKDKHVYLVAYFGDGTFSWCSGAQLKSFEDNFELLSKQTSLKSFSYAVEDALSVFGELVVLEMTGISVARDVAGFVKPVAENAGVKRGVFVPMVGVKSLAVAHIDAAAIMASVRDAARSVSVKNGLELTMLKSKLSAFCRTKGYGVLPEYQSPVYILGLEDLNTNDKNGPVGRPVSNEDYHTPLASSSKKSHAVQEDKLYGRKKRKSLADIIREETDTDMQNSKDYEETPLKSRGKRRRKRAFQTDLEGKCGQSSLSKGKKGARSSQKTKSNKDIKGRSVGNAETVSVDDNDQRDNVEVDVAKRKKGRKKVAASIDENDGTPVKSRDKKRNKDSPKSMASVKHLGFESVVLDLHTDNKVGERMSKAAKLIIESPPIKKHCHSMDSTGKVAVNSSATLRPLHERPLGSKLDIVSSSKSSNFDMNEEYDEDDDGKPMSAIIFLTFSEGVSLPTKPDLLAKYRQFGSLNETETYVLPSSLTAQVVFIKKSEGEHAFDEMVKMNSGDSGVQYRIRYVPRISNVRGLDGSAPPKASPLSDQMKNDVHPVSVSYLKQKLVTVISKLNDTEGETLSGELIIELQSELTHLLEKLSRDF